MSVRLNITMDDDVYARLKKAVPPKKLSAFIAGAVRAKLHPDVRTLNAAYQAASKERYSAAVRSRPPVRSNMFRSARSFAAVSGAAVTCSGTTRSASSSLPLAGITARQLRRIVVLCSSLQSWMIHLRM